MGKKEKRASLKLKENGFELAGEPPKPAGRAVRSADAFLRIGVSAQLDLSKSADQKAQVMLTICAAISTYSLGRSYDVGARYPAFILVGFALVAALFAIMSMRPPRPRSNPPKPGQPGFNILTFTHFARLTPQEYRDAMHALVQDPAQMHDQITDAMYAYGAIFLKRQYYYLEWCYRMFLAGLVLSAIGWAYVLW